MFPFQKTDALVLKEFSSAFPEHIPKGINVILSSYQKAVLHLIERMGKGADAHLALIDFYLDFLVISQLQIMNFLITRPW